ncbi:hypothetical protein SCOR_26430 [Sulfidibacter corallicola]|uniref:DUF4412 domain-containing protein n=1 Tax=Sulfidibacter corallicola TaxID=2818388 RepID=A0A8A4TQ09_SULCO|nr:hypothetical protein [Sulfidibacter corallicola]QTD52066.1 hypothetical protein J3U87_06295 [Sulfidibacter corallicola]
MKRIGYLLFAALLTVSTISSAWGGSDPEAAKWMKKMVAVYQKAPLSMNMSAKMEMSQQGMSMKMDMNGDIIYKDAKHQHMDIKTKMEMGQGQAMDMSMLYIMDGTTFWMEMQMPPSMGGMKQVMKMSIDQMEKMAEKQGMGGMGMSPGAMDPAKIMENMEKMMDLKYEGTKDGKVTLSAEMTPEASKKMGIPTNMGQKMKITLDEKNIFPSEIAFLAEGEGAAPMMVMSFQNLKFLKSVDDAKFTYTPPEGVMVQDLGKMLEGMQGGGHQGHSHGPGEDHKH